MRDFLSLKTMTENLAENLASVNEKIARAARKAGRNPNEIKLVAVSKTHPAEMVEKAVEAGANFFGENKIQEAETKINRIGTEKAKWHLIGHLQSNKARKAVKLFDVIETVDSIELAERLERICEEEARENLPVFIEVKLADEISKNGVSEKDLPPIIDFLQSCEHVQCQGLMTVPPYFEDAEKVRQYFVKLRQIRDRLLPNGELSMGMSGDYETAVEEGATIVRVGTAIFGEREKKVHSQ